MEQYTTEERVQTVEIYSKNSKFKSLVLTQRVVRRQFKVRVASFQLIENFRQKGAVRNFLIQADYELSFDNICVVQKNICEDSEKPTRRRSTQFDLARGSLQRI